MEFEASISGFLYLIDIHRSECMYFNKCSKSVLCTSKHLQVKIPNCHSRILMKLCTLVKLCKIIDTYFFYLRRNDFKCRNNPLYTGWGSYSKIQGGLVLTMATPSKVKLMAPVKRSFYTLRLLSETIFYET